MANVRRNYVAIEDFVVTTELAVTENSTAHDRAVVRGLGSQRHALGVHSIEARAIEEFCHDREISVATEQLGAAAHDRARVLCDRALGTRTKWHCASDRSTWAHATEASCRDINFSVVID